MSQGLRNTINELLDTVDEANPHKLARLLHKRATPEVLHEALDDMLVYAIRECIHSRRSSTAAAKWAPAKPKYERAAEDLAFLRDRVAVADGEWKLFGDLTRADAEWVAGSYYERAAANTAFAKKYERVAALLTGNKTVKQLPEARLAQVEAIFRGNGTPTLAVAA